MKRLSMVLGLIVGALLAASLLTACSSSGGDSPSGGDAITVKGTEFKFTPADITVQSGQKVTVTLENDGAVVHNWTVMDLDGKNVTTGDVQPGQKKSVEFTPTKAGTYKIECTIPGHAEAGMVGTLTVK